MSLHLNSQSLTFIDRLSHVHWLIAKNFAVQAQTAGHYRFCRLFDREAKSKLQTRHAGVRFDRDAAG